MPAARKRAESKPAVERVDEVSAGKVSAEPELRKLVANVYVDGVLYSAGDDVPAEVATRITNPKAWGADASQDA